MRDPNNYVSRFCFMGEDKSVDKANWTKEKKEEGWNNFVQGGGFFTFCDSPVTRDKESKDILETPFYTSEKVLGVAGIDEALQLGCHRGEFTQSCLILSDSVSFLPFFMSLFAVSGSWGICGVGASAKYRLKMDSKAPAANRETTFLLFPGVETIYSTSL